MFTLIPRFQLIENKVQMPETRFSVGTCYQAVIHRCKYEVENLEYIIDESLKTLCIIP